VLLDGQDLDGPYAGDVAPRGVDALDDEADAVEPVGQLDRRTLDGGEVAEP
jgi:hypothetical protein